MKKEQGKPEHTDEGVKREAGDTVSAEKVQ